jgi:hypothetical protein
MTDDARPPDWSWVRRVATILATVIVLGFGCLSAVRVVDPSNLRVGAAPIAFDDHALQFYYGQLGSRFLTEGGRMHGYDPHFMAGYPKSPVYYPSCRPYEISLWLFSGSDAGRVFNWTVLVLLAACPVLMYCAAWSLGLSPLECAAVAGLTAVPHLLAPIADFYRFIEPAGMESFIFASALSVLVVALFAHFVRWGGVVTGLALWATAPLLYLAHPASILISILPMAVAWVSCLRRMTVGRHLWLAVVLATTVAVNWSWIEGQLLFGHYADLRDFYSAGGRRHLVPEGGLLAPLRTFVPTPKMLGLLPPILGCVGLVLWWRERRWHVLVVSVPTILFLFAFSFYGRYANVTAVTPGRMTLPLGLWLLPPAAHALAVGIPAFARAAVTMTGRAAAGPAALLALATAVSISAWRSDLETRVWRWYTFPSIEQSEGFTRHGMALMRWLAEHTDASGRLLNEETDRGSHQYYGSHLPALIPLYTGLELAGGPAPHALLEHNVLRFEAGTLLGQPIGRIPSDALLHYLSLYNVRWLLCWTPAAKRYLAAIGGVAKVGSYDKFTLYRLEAPPSYFFEGSGIVEASDNRLVLRDLVPHAGRIVLKYHWLETLRTDPPRDIRPFWIDEDPVPFIAVADPPRDLTIYNDYGIGVADWLRGRLKVSRATAGGG